MDPNQIAQATADVALRFGLKVLGALVIFVIGLCLRPRPSRRWSPPQASRSAWPYTHTDHYWQVYFDATRTIAHAFAEVDFPAPYTLVAARNPG